MMRIVYSLIGAVLLAGTQPARAAIEMPADHAKLVTLLKIGENLSSLRCGTACRIIAKLQWHERLSHSPPIAIV